MSNIDPTINESGETMAPRTAFEIVRAIKNFDALLSANVTDDVKSWWNDEGGAAVLYDHDNHPQFLGDVDDWDGEFLSFAKLKVLGVPGGTMRFDFNVVGSERADDCPPSTQEHLSFFAQRLMHGRAPKGTVIAREIAIVSESSSLIREAVADPDLTNGAKYGDWRPATEVEGRAILSDIQTLTLTTQDYILKNPGIPVYN